MNQALDLINVNKQTLQFTYDLPSKPHTPQIIKTLVCIVLFDYCLIVIIVLFEELMIEELLNCCFCLFSIAPSNHPTANESHLYDRDGVHLTPGGTEVILTRVSQLVKYQLPLLVERRQSICTDVLPSAQDVNSLLLLSLSGSETKMCAVGRQRLQQDLLLSWCCT